ncbi:uncharacterized protein P174DRAFT_441272 [Aspergillus novofumigatus IBT 16806]|uniref:Uncharacterized protein n=1 Tax=Aspergillus novofumigatus (strain IBT 16806) TaxID=1392255 RepID=A0A2I1C8T6_ASPN1|nr:uncharacterized protein P174DRAFT_441272 [Aspergillus novofumigatus IBT 16806]PKX94005.1 hypothetical protein P174DRAFT_441272 [Aspergillus novofumigatus IBT 16806]
MGMPAEFSNFRTLEIFKRGPPTSGNHLHRAHILIKLVFVLFMVGGAGSRRIQILNVSPPPSRFLRSTLGMQKLDSPKGRNGYSMFMVI